VAYGDRQRCRGHCGSAGSTGVGVGLLRGVAVTGGEGRVIIHGGRGTGARTKCPGGMAG
jgi:hypothetical protein